MPNQIGSKVRINGMDYHVDSIARDERNRPIIILSRDFDNSLWYAQCRNVNRFTHLKRIPDIAHVGLDVYDVMNTTDIAVRRI